VGAVNSAHTTPTASCTSVCTAAGSASSPLQGTITYKVTNGSTVVAYFVLTVNLGSLSTRSSYQAAES